MDQVVAGLREQRRRVRPRRMVAVVEREVHHDLLDGHGVPGTDMTRAIPSEWAEGASLNSAVNR